MLKRNEHIVKRVPPNEKSFYGGSHYLTRHFIETIAKYVDLNGVANILDVGSRAARQSLEFANWFPDAHIWAFEANPAAIQLCKEHTKNENRITVVPKAAHEYEGTVDFHPVLSHNIGASSIFKVKSDYKRERLPQSHITVPCTRIDEEVEQADLIWMDVQGAELYALRGSKWILPACRAVVCETAVKPYYEGHTMKEDIDAYMSVNGFRAVDFKLNFEYEGDTIYVNENFILEE